MAKTVYSPNTMIHRLTLSRSGSRLSNSRETKTLERGASSSATRIRHDGQLEHCDVGQLDLIFLGLAHRHRWAEVPLLADDLPERAPAVGRPTQDELLRPRFFFLFKEERYLLQPLRLVENHSDCLGPGYSCTPPLHLSRKEGRLDRELFILRRDFDDGRPLDIEPPFAAGPNSLCRCWSNEPFPHAPSVYLCRGHSAGLLHRMPRVFIVLRYLDSAAVHSGSGSARGHSSCHSSWLSLTTPFTRRTGPCLQPAA
jgi:hypothetical protein